jgi:hypothetical protein
MLMSMNGMKFLFSIPYGKLGGLSLDRASC